MFNSIFYFFSVIPNSVMFSGFLVFTVNAKLKMGYLSLLRYITISMFLGN